MSVTNQIIGGTFTSNGYLLFRLVQDAVVNGSTLVSKGKVITVPLDSSGNIVTSTAYKLWPNDVMTPSSTYYMVSAYTSAGQLIWGPNAMVVLSSPSPFNIGAVSPF